MLSALKIEEFSILDYGCGSGSVIDKCSRLLIAKHFYGYDPFYVHETSENKDNVTFSSELNEQNFYNLIMALDVVEHLQDLDKFLELASKHSGYLYLHVPLEINFYSILSGDHVKTFRTFGHINFFTEELLLERLRSHGFSTVSINYLNTMQAINPKSLMGHLRKWLASVVFMMSIKYCAKLLNGITVSILVSNDKN
jgi:predicted TPR repeat methyltransferase